MNTKTKMALAAAAATALAASVQAQLPVSGYNPGDLLLGFTTPSSTGDLVIDLGSASQIGVGSGLTLNLNDNGNVGMSAAALTSELTTLYGGLGGLSFGVVGSKYVNAANNFVYSTVPQGDPAPIIANVGALKSSVALVATPIGDGSAAANSAIVNPGAGYGYSWTEGIKGTGNGQWGKYGTDPNSTTPATFTSGSVVEDLYANINGTESLVGSFTFFSDGNLAFSAASVPEPTTVSLLGGFGLLVLVLRRSARKSA
jgi:hypothetical protein